MKTWSNVKEMSMYLFFEYDFGVHMNNIYIIDKQNKLLHKVAKVHKSLWKFS